MRASASIFSLLFIMITAPPAGFPQDRDHREIFARAHASYVTGDLSRAQELFEKTLDPKFSLADYSLHYLALIALQEKNYDLARQRLTQLKRRYPQSVWFYHAELQRAKINLAEKKLPPALAILKSLVRRNAKNEIAAEARYLLAQAHESQGDPRSAYLHFLELRDADPLSRWAMAARKEQARLKNQHPVVFGFDTLQSITEEADRLVREREWGEAEVLYRKLLNNVADPALRLSVLGKLAGLFLTVRKRNEAIPILQEIARDFPETHQAPRALYQIGQIYWNRNDNALALSNFHQVVERYPTSSYADRARFALGDIYESFGDHDAAAQFYSRLQREASNSPLRDDAIWRLAWLHYRAGAFHAAAATFGTLASESQTRLTCLAAMYWQARSAERSNDEGTAKELYGQIAKIGDETYYQILAVGALQRLGIVIEEPKPQIRVASSEPIPFVSPEISFHLTRARDLTAISLSELAVAELDEAHRRSRKQLTLLPTIMREYFRNQAYSRSLAVANRLPGSNSERDLFRFPLAYWDVIQAKAEERELDPYLVLGLIRQESLFDAQARSPASALGLMQLLPSTATRVAEQIGVATPSSEKLFEPEINLTLGTEYLKTLMQRYSNNWFKAIAAYNAGEAAVDRWEREIITDDLEEFVERIPYVETRGYVKLVMRNHRMYRKLYATQK
jgi:soluble lytic murein transglycosylase